jgi:hypothetical protein
LKKIAELNGLSDANEVNLKNAVENNILEPPKEHGYIQTYSATKGLSGTKYILWRNTNTKGKDRGSVKPG